MTMKFRFVKNETAPDDRGSVSCAVWDIPASVVKSGSPSSVAAPLFAAPQRLASALAERECHDKKVFIKSPCPHGFYHAKIKKSRRCMLTGLARKKIAPSNGSESDAYEWFSEY